MMTKRSAIGLTTLLAVVAFVAAAFPATSRGQQPKHESHQQGASQTTDAHAHAPLPPEYAKVAAPPGLWTDAAMIARGRSIYAEKCAACHGERGDGKTLASGDMRLKPSDLTDRAMVAALPDAYWFWRVSEGGAVVEPFLSRGSIMPAYKDLLSPEERWAVIAYQHTFSGHTGAHVAAEHPEMRRAEMAGGSMPGGMPGMPGHGAAAQPTRREPGMPGMSMPGATDQPRMEHPAHRGAVPAAWTTRDQRWQPRGPWMWAVPRELPQFFRELNGIDFGHAHLAETLLRTQDQDRVERARLDVLDFIFSSPRVPPDEDQVTPTLVRMVWEVQRAFNWAHMFHRTLYDLFASDEVPDKEAAYRKILATYLAKPEAITSHRLDHHGKLWSFPESKTFRDKFPKFNVQIWSYHWLQAATYDVQLMGNAATQRELMPKLIAHYHGYLRNPPVEWQMMPMLPEGSPEFGARFSEAAAVFDNLHMLHDNIDDVLSRPDLYPTVQAKRETILKILSIYLHRNHAPEDRYPEFHGMMMGTGMMDMGPRPPSAKEVLEGKVPERQQRSPAPAERPAGTREQH